MADLQSLIQQKIGLREQEIANQQQQLNTLQNAPKQMDLTALMAAADLFGEKGSPSMMGMYQHMKPKDNTMKIQALGQQLMQQKQGLTGDQINLLKALNKNQKAAAPKKLTANMIKKINEGNAIPDMLSNVSGLIEENKGDFGPVEGRLRSANPYDTDAQALNAEMRAKSQAFGRFMEGGVLRKEDEEKYKKMFPSLADTHEVAQEKLRVVEDLLAQKQGSDLDAFAAQGFDITGLELPVKKEKKKPAKKKVDRNAQAKEWAAANPDDPRAAKILEKIGAK